MGFFVILWVLKPSATPQPNTKTGDAQTEQWLETVGQIRGEFGWEPDPKSTDPVDQAVLRMRVRNGPGEKGEVVHPPKGAQGTDPEVMSIRPGQQAIVGGKLLFEKRDATLQPDVTRSLDEVAKTIRGHRNIVLIKGHTSRDDFPDTATAEQRMDLSIARAQAVADYLTRAGVEPEILRVQGCSIFEPVAERAYTPESQSVNRRVEVEATSTLVEDLQDNGKAARATTEPAPTPSN
jgi:outer membrane protein OmpA-like peptidoglycan-associated protein